MGIRSTGGEDGIFTYWQAQLFFGEGPIANADIKINAQGFNDGQYTKAGADEIRFTQAPSPSGKAGDGALYITPLAWPKNHTVTIKALAAGSDLFTSPIKTIELLGYGKVKFTRTNDALIVTLPEPTNNIMPVLKIKK